MGITELLRQRVRLREAKSAASRTATADGQARRLAGNTGAQLAGLAADYRDGSLSRADFISDAESLLADAGMSASAIGDLLQQALAGVAPDDQEDGEATADTRRPWVLALIVAKQPYLHGFADAIPELSPEAAAARADQWGNLAWTAYQMGKGQRGAAEGLTDLDWNLDPGVTNHCGGCQGLADGGPYTMDTIPTWPGNGDTECMANCYCSVSCSLPDEGDGGDEGG